MTLEGYAGLKRVSILRSGREEDAPRIAALQLASWRATYAAELSPSYFEKQDLAAWTERWRGCIAGGENLILIEEVSTLVGFVSCGPARGRIVSERAWQIYNIHVAPDRHDEGIGGRLFEAAAELGREHGARQLMLWVVETNSSARTFYERRGMRWDGGAQDDEVGEEVFHEVRYRRDL